MSIETPVSQVWTGLFIDRKDVEWVNDTFGDLLLGEDKLIPWITVHDRNGTHAAYKFQTAKITVNRTAHTVELVGVYRSFVPDGNGRQHLSNATRSGMIKAPYLPKGNLMLAATLEVT